MIRYARYIITACMLSLVTLLAAQTVKIQTQHKVKKSETRYGIAKQYGITIDQLEAANPEMRMPGYELKKGDYINIPVRADAPAEANTPAATSTHCMTRTATAAAWLSITVDCFWPATVCRRTASLSTCMRGMWRKGQT